MGRFSFYRIGAVSGVAGALLSLSSALPANAQEKIKLEVWSWQITKKQAYDEVFSIYEKAHPEIDVEFRGFPDTDYPTVLRSGLSGGDGPDLVFLHPYSSIAPYSKSGQLVSISSKTVPELANFGDEALAATELDGETWGIPFAQQSLQIFYNKAVFQKAGVVPPTKRSDVEPMLEKLKSSGVVPIAAQGVSGSNITFYFDLLSGNAYGGKAFVEKVVSGEGKLDSDPMIKAFAQFKSYEKYMPPHVAGVSADDAISLFISGRAAMIPNGAWLLGLLRRDAPSLDIGVFTMPHDDAGDPPPVYGYEDGAIALSKRSEHPKEALELLRWMGTEEFGKAFTNVTKQASSVRGVEPVDSLLKQMVASYRANPVPVIWVTNFFGTSSPAPFAALSVLGANVLAGTMTPEAAATELQENLDEFELMK